MAEFNPAISPTQSDNYTTRSQGQTPNKAFQYLFGGIADAVSAFKNNQKEAAKAKEAQDKLNFENDVGAGLDDMSGGDYTGARHVGGAGSAPVNFEAAREIDGTIGQLTRLKSGVNQGTVTDIYFSQQRAAKVKDLMSKYPQYSQTYIEQQLDEAMGHSAAVEYRKGLAKLQDEQNKFSSDEEKRVKQLKKDWANDGYFTNEEIRTHYKQLTGSDLNPTGDINEDAMNIAISGEVNIDKQMARHEAELRMREGDKKVQREMAEDFAVKDMQAATQKIFYTAMNADKARIQYLMRQGANITPQQTQELIAKMGEMEGQLNIAAEGIVSKYTQYIPDSNKREDIKKVMLGPFATMKQLVEDKNFGALGAVANYTSALKNRKDLEFQLKNGDFVQNLELAQKKYGAEAVQKFFDPTLNNIANMDEGQRALFDKISLDIYGGNKPVHDVINELKIMGGVTQKDSNVIYLGIQRAINQGLDPDMTKTQSAEYFKKTLFSPEGVNVLRGMADPGRIFPMFVNNAMTEKLKGTTTWDEYVGFAMDQASILMKPAGDTIIDTQKYTYRGIVNYDEKSGKFSLTTQGIGFDSIDNYATQNGQKAVSQMNAYMDAMKPILDAEGITPDQFLQGVMVGREYKKIAKEGSMLQRMGDAFYKHIQEFKFEDSKGRTPHPPGASRGKDDVKVPYDFFQSIEGPTGPHNSIEGHQNTGASSRNYAKTGNPMVDLISRAEGAGYNTMFGGKEHPNLTKLSIAEVLDLQQKNIKSAGGSPAGAPQVTAKTLKGLIKDGVVKLSDTFNEQTQEKIIHHLMETAGYSKFVRGDLDPNAFADNLAGIWASLPLPNGDSAYKGVAGNHARISRQQLMDAIERLRQ